MFNSNYFNLESFEITLYFLLWHFTEKHTIHVFIESVFAFKRYLATRSPTQSFLVVQVSFWVASLCAATKSFSSRPIQLIQNFIGISLFTEPLLLLLFHWVEAL
uniref:Uncharacterized protein n=1 Tax=Micrurus paraensis TaxID=1970185 RepID=A0A2D4L1X5_9SAUR